jgi:hypothetical protein
VLLRHACARLPAASPGQAGAGLASGAAPARLDDLAAAQRPRVRDGGRWLLTLRADRALSEAGTRDGAVTRGRQWVVLVDYWLAASYGRMWGAARRALRLRAISAGLPELCARVARGERLPASELGMAEDFATAMWWRSGVVAIILMVIIGVAAKGTVHGAALNTVAGLLLALGFYAAIAVMVAVMAFVRAAGNRAYLRRAGPSAIQEPLPTGEIGMPRRWDFWAVLAFGAAMVAVIGYAGLHSAPH